MWKEKQEKRKDLKYTLAIGINTTNLNLSRGYRKKNTHQIVCYNCSKKGHYSKKNTKSRKILKTSIGIADLGIGDKN